LIKTDQGGNY